MTVQVRKTKQKDAIRSAFLAADRPLSPEETLTYAKEAVAGISIATIYRNIGSLVEDQWLTPVAVPGESTRYEVAGKQHHHHFRCTGCSRIFELPGCTLRYQEDLPPGFQVTGHEFFLLGMCASCS